MYRLTSLALAVLALASTGLSHAQPFNCSPDGAWLRMGPANAPAEPMAGSSLVWTDTALIVWGGKDAGGAPSNLG